VRTYEEMGVQRLIIEDRPKTPSAAASGRPGSRIADTAERKLQGRPRRRQSAILIIARPMLERFLELELSDSREGERFWRRRGLPIYRSTRSIERARNHRQPILRAVVANAAEAGDALPFYRRRSRHE